ncbi:MAG: hypothetical protein AAF961_18585, partial [Planctomycetota bacterium]
GDAFGGNSGQPASNAATITLDDIQRVMIGTVAPQSWAQNGQGAGQVQALGTALVVWQSPEVHEQIQDLLAQLREGSGQRTTVAIDARWLLLNSEELDALTAVGEDGQRTVDHDILTRFTRRATSLRGMTTCFSGQLVYLVSGTRKNVVSSYIPVVGSIERAEGNLRFATSPNPARTMFLADGEGGFGGGQGVGYQPIIEKPNFGALLEIRPTLMNDGGTVVVDVKSTITVPGRSPVPTPPAGWGPATPVVDRVAIETQDLATTCRLRLATPMIVGGLTSISPAAALSDGGTSTDEANGSSEATRPTVDRELESSQLYLLLAIRKS